jgi:NAD(P)-dependent dehydrogenase (short-subunit alcohol dehydrogenase family)
MREQITRTVLITGASRGLGLALARSLAERRYALIIDSRGEQALDRVRDELARKTRVFSFAGDIGNVKHQKALLDAARGAGGIDVLVNNASMLGPSPQPLLLEYPLEMLRQVFGTNVIAVLSLIQTLHPTFKPGARIINVTSDAGSEAYAGWGGYGASKAALEQLSAVLAVENPSLKIYWVDPGDMRTQMQQEAYPGEDISDRPPPEASVPGMLELIDGDLPSGRYVARQLSSTRLEESNHRNE